MRGVFGVRRFSRRSRTSARPTSGIRRGLPVFASRGARRSTFRSCRALPTSASTTRPGASPSSTPTRARRGSPRLRRGGGSPRSPQGREIPAAFACFFTSLGTCRAEGDLPLGDAECEGAPDELGLPVDGRVREPLRLPVVDVAVYDFGGHGRGRASGEVEARPPEVILRASQALQAPPLVVGLNVVEEVAHVLMRAAFGVVNS